MKWTKELIDQLTLLWGQGESANNIAKILNTTKGTIIGKVHRLKLPQHGAIIYREVQEDGQVTYTSASVVEKQKAEEQKLREEPVEPFVTGKDWTERQVAKLKLLLSDGLSFSKIAAILGITKNAVCGKVRRLKLSGEVKSEDKPKQTQNTKEEETVCIHEDVECQCNKNNPEPVVEVQERQIAKENNDKFIKETILKNSDMMSSKFTKPNKHGKTLFELKYDECRWPIGDPKDEDFHFCGDKAVDGKPYCAKHCAFAYIRADNKIR